MASFDMNLDREYDTVHARIADLHTKAAYEHSTANYLQKGCDSDLAHQGLQAFNGSRRTIEAGPGT
jgi:hypothetical protein